MSAEANDVRSVRSVTHLRLIRMQTAEKSGTTAVTESSKIPKTGPKHSLPVLEAFAHLNDCIIYNNYLHHSRFIIIIIIIIFNFLIILIITESLADAIFYDGVYQTLLSCCLAAKVMSTGVRPDELWTVAAQDGNRRQLSGRYRLTFQSTSQEKAGGGGNSAVTRTVRLLNNSALYLMKNI